MSNKKEHLGELLGMKSAESSRSAASQFITGSQKPVITETQGPETKSVKKATFDMDPELHKQLKIYAAQSGKSMVEVLQEALLKHMQGN